MDITYLPGFCNFDFPSKKLCDVIVAIAALKSIFSNFICFLFQQNLDD